MCSKAFRYVLGIGLWWFCLAGWAAVDGGRLVEAARTQVGVTLGYDPAYRRIAYPGGDVPLATGVCTDVVIRALRAQGLDLQQRVHEDMRRHFSAYPRHWGLKRPDPNIDHRRVPNLMTWFDRQGLSLKVGQAAADYQPGDIVTWDLGRGLQHIGIISDRRSREGTPLALHNIGQGTQEEDILFRWPILGHYRFAAH
ncbi:DUF1287 domain-containing protein [Pseudomonas sp. zfem003]|uniref:DUF1287 domain-containing protein n=1 Tax=Pseudomonas sp. zfem003 TaxID=3078198 RepID=UPI0029285CC2|nr:DUF1287 domain-containing protein [Pseudomonas sp. zfem003]MDU9398551.1 DUF1287 domain-containing protein [Pseudomonas sp. zfem003]